MEPQSQEEGRFPHHKLDVFAVAVELAVFVKRIVDAFPKGHRALADQMQRAATSVVLLIAEGANRRTPADKRYRYTMARGECGELAAALELAVAYGIAANPLAGDAKDRAGRVNAMLLRLEQRFGPGYAVGGE